MKIMEYPKVTTLSEDTVFLIDGTNGTKTILTKDAILAALGLNSIYNHRMVFRGKNLGTTVSEAQKVAIKNGSFDDIWLGDYWVINDVTYRVVDFNYWYNKGDTKLTTPHLVIMPDSGLTTASMNDTSVTTNGYVGSKMYTSHMTSVKATVNAAFPSLVLSHREYLINAVTSGYPSQGAWFDSTVELPNEIMIFGSYINTPSSAGTTDVKRYTNSNTQLALFAVNPSLIPGGNGYWLRDVASATHFTRVDAYGGATSTGAANSYSIRPVFAIG